MIKPNAQQKSFQKKTINDRIFNENEQNRINQHDTIAQINKKVT